VDSHQNIRGLDVSMYDSFLVGVLYRETDLHEDAVHPMCPGSERVIRNVSRSHGRNEISGCRPWRQVTSILIRPAGTGSVKHEIDQEFDGALFWRSPFA